MQNRPRTYNSSPLAKSRGGNKYTLSGSAPKPRKKNRGSALWLRRFIALCVALTVIAGVVYLITLIPKRENNAAQRLWFNPTDPSGAFGADFLFLSGGMLSCVGVNGELRWQQTLAGANADFSAESGFVAAWSGRQYMILDSSGKILVSDTMAGNVQFARVGASYAAALIGEGAAQFILLTDHMGNVIERIEDLDAAFVTDFGFFDSSDVRLWVLGMDLEGAETKTVFSTYDPRSGRSTGSADIFDQLIYNVYKQNKLLMLAGTSSLTAYDYNCTQSTAIASVTAYGWQLARTRAVRNETYALLRKNPQSADNRMTREFRLVASASDLQLRPPEPCFDGLLGSRGVYLFSAGKVYSAPYGSAAFTATDLPVQIDSLLCILEGDVAIAASGAEVYILKLPQPK
ncbi:MAG: hypothetical protein LBD16_05505 [Oscillospiraceae bacterium]|jgi:hypothetical protein|nr:hypothetical protein [Oscillospiraceae bacterium]